MDMVAAFWLSSRVKNEAMALMLPDMGFVALPLSQ